MSVLGFLKSTPPNYRISIENAIREASPKNAEEIIEKSINHLKDIKRLDVLRKYPQMNDAKALAIIAYTLNLGMTDERSLYYKLRNVLRERDVRVISDMKGYLLHLLSALRSLTPVPNDKPLYRGIDSAFYKLDEYRPGSKITWHEFTTAVPEISAAHQFIRGKEKPLIFEIRGNYTGHAIGGFSKYPISDVILEPGTVFVVKEVKDDDEIHNAKRIVLEVIPTLPVISGVVKNFNDVNHPGTTLEVSVPSVPEGWEVRVDEKSGRYYYANLITKTTQWELPTAPATPPSPPQQQQCHYQQGSFLISSDRFSACVESDELFDSLDESEIVFAPLTKYVFTLEKALEEAGLSYALEDSLAQGKVAIERPKIAGFGLTPDEAGAISCYTLQAPKGLKSPYKVINERLSSERSADGLHSTRKFIFLLLNGLRKLERFVPGNSQTLYRGMGRRVPLTKEEANGHQFYAIGQTVTWWGFTSTTLDWKVAEKFMKGVEKKTFFKIMGSNKWGYDLRPFSTFKEEEILFEPEVKIKVNGITDTGNVLSIDAEFVPFKSLPLESVIPIQNPLYLRPIEMNQGNSVISSSGSGLYQGYQMPQGTPQHLQMGQMNQMNQGIPQITIPQQQQQGIPGVFANFNQAFHHGQQQQQILQQQYIQEQAQQQQQCLQQLQQPPQGFPKLPGKKDPPKLIPYPNYNNTDIARPIQITAFTNTSNAMMYYSGIRRVSPNVVYESVDKALAGKSQERTMDRFTSGGCFGEFRQIPRKNNVKGEFYFSCMNTTFGSVTRESYNDLMKYLKLDDKVESNFHLAAVYCGVQFDGLFETMDTGRLRATGNYLHYFIEGGKLLQDYHGKLYHVIDDYQDGDFVTGKEYTTKYPISCTDDQQIIMGQVAKVAKKCVLKFVNVPAKIMPQLPGPLSQFNEAVVLPGCKMKVNNVFTDNTGLKFIELYPVDLVWSDDHLFRKKPC